VRNRTKSGRHTKWRSKDERGASTVEFALILPVFALLLFALVDFGMVFSGYTTMRSGVATSARLASLNEYTYSGSASCSGGPSAATADMVCNTMSAMGKILAIVPGSVEVGICFTPNSSGGSCSSSTESASQTGNQCTPISGGGSQPTTYCNVEICAQATMKSTTGLTAPFLNGRVISTSSTNRLELGLSTTSGPTPTAFDVYDSSDTGASLVKYNGTTVNPEGCP
jgi:Flp pilus assembly protein TadG